MVKILLMIKIPDAGKTVSPITYLYNHVLSPAAGPYLGSLIYPLFLIVLWVLLMLPLYRKENIHPGVNLVCETSGPGSRNYLPVLLEYQR